MEKTEREEIWDNTLKNGLIADIANNPKKLNHVDNPSLGFLKDIVAKNVNNIEEIKGILKEKKEIDPLLIVSLAAHSFDIKKNQINSVIEDEESILSIKNPCYDAQYYALYKNPNLAKKIRNLNKEAHKDSVIARHRIDNNINAKYIDKLKTLSKIQSEEKIFNLSETAKKISNEIFIDDDNTKALKLKV